MTRDEHLTWAKQRALEYLDHGDTMNAYTSMLSDMSKHDELKNNKGCEIGVGFMLIPGWLQDERQVRRWIEGFR